MIERSLVLLKPDAVKRGIVGEIIARIERPGLKIIGAKFVRPTQEMADKHYEKDDAWAEKVGGFNIKDCETFGLNVEEIYGTTDTVKIGHTVNSWVKDYLTSGPVLAIVFEGNNAVQKIRQLVGSTFPIEAPPGTIRGDYELESTYTALKRKSGVYNLIHASGLPEEAEFEISLWFKEEELFDYSILQENVYNC
jgi:nucleoside-diphosphate kinase